MKRPVFALLVVSTLAVGIGANVAVFGYLSTYLCPAWAGSRLLASVLYGVSAHDGTTFATVPAVLAALGLLAAWLPARRASRVDPMTALRQE